MSRQRKETIWKSGLKAPIEGIQANPGYGQWRFADYIRNVSRSTKILWNFVLVNLNRALLTDPHIAIGFGLAVNSRKLTTLRLDQASNM